MKPSVESQKKVRLTHLNSNEAMDAVVSATYEVYQ